MLLKPMKSYATLYPIVICGPASPRLLVNTAAGGVIVSTNGTAYPSSELERSAPLFEGVPCYHRHNEDGVSETFRELMRVGTIRNPRWSPATNELLADLLVTDEHWKREIKTWRSVYGFSMATEVSCREAGGMTIVDKIVSVKSVDLVEWADPACGGRWADKSGAPAQMINKWIG